VGEVRVVRIVLKAAKVWERKFLNSVVWTISMRSRISPAAWRGREKKGKRGEGGRRI